MKTSQFYDELQDAITEAQTRGKEVNFRKVVVDGLKMNDSATGKIKDGTYVPSNERITDIAKFLGVKPSRFSAFIAREANIRLDPKRPDKDLLGVFRALSRVPKSRQAEAKRVLLSFTEELVERVAG